VKSMSGLMRRSKLSRHRRGRSISPVQSGQSALAVLRLISVPNLPEAGQAALLGFDLENAMQTSAVEPALEERQN